MQVVKRDGKLEEFDPAKIEVAIKKANIQAKKSDKITKADIEEIVNEVAAKCEMKKKVKVEEIQDLIVPELYKKSPKLAQSFERYRYKREVGRTGSSEFLSAIKEKLEASDVQNQNANVDERSFGGRMGETNSLVMKRYALDYCMSTMSRENHLNNEIYIHDLDSYAVGMHNCLSIPFDKLLAEGFTTRQTDVRPANSINTAFQLVAVIFQLQSLQQFGGVSATHLDWTMVPYVRRSFKKHYLQGLKWVENVEEFEIDPDTPIDSQIYKEHPKAYDYANEMTTKETYQAVEAMYHNLNTLQSRSGCQLPFTSINYGTCTLPEGRLVIKTILEVSIKGIGKTGRTPIFPCGIFQCMKGVNRKPGDPNYDLFKLALQSTAKRLYPNFMSCNWSVDQNGNELDRQAKQKYLDSLTSEQMQKLVEWCENNKEMADMLGLKVVEE